MAVWFVFFFISYPIVRQIVAAISVNEIFNRFLYIRFDSFVYHLHTSILIILNDDLQRLSKHTYAHSVVPSVLFLILPFQPNKFQKKMFMIQVIYVCNLESLFHLFHQVNCFFSQWPEYRVPVGLHWFNDGRSFRCYNIKQNPHAITRMSFELIYLFQNDVPFDVEKDVAMRSIFRFFHSTPFIWFHCDALPRRLFNKTLTHPFVNYMHWFCFFSFLFILQYLP